MDYLGRSNLMTRDLKNRDLSLAGVGRTPCRDRKRGHKEEDRPVPRMRQGPHSTKGSGM